MIEETKAFRASDGKLFTDELVALKYETELKLESILGKVCTVEIMQKLSAVFDTIEPLAMLLQSIKKAGQQNLQGRSNA